jgi:hypothetical protein
MDAISKVNLPGNNQDHLIEIMSDHRFQWSFKEKSWSQFWMEVKNEYSEVNNAAVTFPSTIWIYISVRENIFCYGGYKK